MLADVEKNKHNGPFSIYPIKNSGVH
jgi:hypothetical protein